MPGEVAAMAAFSEVSIVGTVGWVEVAPVHDGVGDAEQGRAVREAVLGGVKNALSVTWLTKVNFHFGVVGKFPAAFLAALAVLRATSCRPRAGPRPRPWR